MAIKILAIETSDRNGSVAALETEFEAPSGRSLVLDRSVRTAQSLLPAIERLLASNGWSPADIQLVCVAAGPGSFTGLRIAVTAAKTLAYATGAQLASVSTLATIAAQAGAVDAAVWGILSAQRGELYCARFESETDLLQRCDPSGASAEILSADDWLSRLAAGDVVAGPPLEQLGERVPPGVVVADASLWQPQAETVGRLGYQLHAAGRHVDPVQLTPHYIRRSAAEEKADRASQTN